MLIAAHFFVVEGSFITKVKMGLIVILHLSLPRFDEWEDCLDNGGYGWECRVTLSQHRS